MQLFFTLGTQKHTKKAVAIKYTPDKDDIFREEIEAHRKAVEAVKLSKHVKS